MKNIIGVRFRRLGKIYFFDPQYLILKKGDYVIVDTADGEDIAEVMISNRKMDEEKIVEPLKKVIRIANQKDMKHYEECKRKEKEAFEFCNKKIKEFDLKMKLTDVEYKFNNTKLLFFFTADGRIDFRELVKELAANYKTRIELRQIGVRDEIKRIGGNGVCGRELCCCSFLSDFETVSIKMGTGEIENVEILAERVRVKITSGDNFTYKKYNVKDITIIKDVIAEQQENENNEEIEELERLEQLDKEELKGGEKNGI